MTDPVRAAISTLRVVRRFADRPIDESELDRILKAGRHAGSSKNFQRCEHLPSFGYPADAGDLTRPPKAGGRRALAEIVRHERW
ncbi:MAG: nitroreductase family protein [Chloroflexota bacterium]